LARTDEVRAADADTRLGHVRERGVEARVQLVACDGVRLVRDVRRARDGHDGQRVEVAVCLDRLLQTLVAARLTQNADATRQLEGACEPRHDLSVALPVE